MQHAVEKNEAEIEIVVYELNKESFLKATAKLLEQFLNKNLKMLISCKDQETAELLDSGLWTYSQTSFLPHALETDKTPELQPILITVQHNNENTNHEIVIFIDYMPTKLPPGYSTVVLIVLNEDLVLLLKAIKDTTNQQICSNLRGFSNSDNGVWKKLDLTTY